MPADWPQASSGSAAAIRPPATTTQPKHPSDIATDPAYLTDTYTYHRSDAANTDAKTAINVESVSDLSDWTTAVAGPDIIITESDNF